MALSLPANTATAANTAAEKSSLVEELAYWCALPLRYVGQMAHNGLGILRVLDITRLRPMPAGLVANNHPWVTGINPQTGRPIWTQNVIYRSERAPHGCVGFSDEEIVVRTCRFMADKVALSAVTPPLPQGPRRRMPHAINYIHGASHYNSGILIFNDFADALAHFSTRRFRAAIWRFVRNEQREILILFRTRDYSPRQFAYFTCGLRTLFPWFCNANGPRGRVLWGNASPFVAANLITGYWAKDVYALKRPAGAATVVRPAISAQAYFQAASYAPGRQHYRWPERMLAWCTYWRVRMRGARGGMYFVDRRRVYADQIAARQNRGLRDEPLARM